MATFGIFGLVTLRHIVLNRDHDHLESQKPAALIMAPSNLRRSAGTITWGPMGLYRERIYPMGDVTNDVLLEIFSTCVADSKTEQRPTLSRSEEKPIILTLSQVCKLWRQLAYDFPPFWNQLTVRRESFDADGVAFLSAWLRRAQNMPLDLQFVVPARHSHLIGTDETPPPANSLPKFLYRILKPVCINITRLAIDGAPLAELVALPPKAFPRLERLVLASRSEDEWEDFDWTTHGSIRAFSKTPTLTHVALRRFHRSAEFDHVKLPWGQLTHFIDYGPIFGSADDFFTNILPLCTRLRHLTVYLGPSDVDTLHTAEWESLQSFAMPNLESLNITMPNWGSVDLFQKVQCFNLKKLRLLGGEETMSPATFYDQLANLSSLTHLSLCSTTWATSGAIHLVLASTPHLTTFESVLVEEIVSTLTFHETENPQAQEYRLLPKLEDLTLRYFAQLSRFSVYEEKQRWRGRLPSLIESRIREDPGRTKLRTIRLRATDRFGLGSDRIPNIVSIIQGAIRDGERLEVKADWLDYPYQLMDSMLRDGDLEGWDGVEELAEYLEQ